MLNDTEQELDYRPDITTEEKLGRSDENWLIGNKRSIKIDQYDPDSFDMLHISADDRLGIDKVINELSAYHQEQRPVQFKSQQDDDIER